MPKILIRGGDLLTMDPALGDIPRGSVLVDGDRIAAVGQVIDASGAGVVEAGGMIVLPGFVDAHLHTWQTGLRGVAGDWSLADYFRHMHLNLARQFTPEDLYLANLAGGWGHLDAGVTSLFDWCHNNPTPAHSDRAIDGLAEAGIRAVFGHGVARAREAEGRAPQPHPAGEVRRLRLGRLHDDDALVTLGLAVRGPDATPYEIAAKDIRLALDHGLVASAHVGGRIAREAPDGIRRLHAEGLLGPRFNAVHANQLSDEELRLLASAGATVTACPEVEMQMGHGDPVCGRFAAAGGAPSLGVDIESNVGGEMFTPMRMGLQFWRSAANGWLLRQGQAPERVVVRCRRALEWATIEGARALGLDHRTGSLAPGKQADLILIRKADLNLFPVHDPAQAVVFQANPSNVDSVMVAGGWRKRGGRLLAGNVPATLERLMESGRRIMKDAGMGQDQLS